MSPDNPLACTLTPAELPDRVAEIAAIGRAGLLSAEHAGTRVVLRFRRDPALRGRLEAVVAAEAQCCAFLDMRLTDGDDATVLTIAAPAGGEPILADLIEAFGGREKAATMGA